MRAHHRTPMKQLLLIPTLLLGMLLATGCTSTRTLGDASDYAAINQKAQTQEATVILLNGSSFEAQALQMTPDSSSWRDASGRYRSVTTAQIRDVQFWSRGRGAGNGLLIGAAIGAAGTAIWGYSLYDDSCDLCDSPSEDPFFLLAVGAGTLAGGLLGSLVGAGTKGKITYRVPREAREAYEPTSEEVNDLLAGRALSDAGREMLLLQTRGRLTPFINQLTEDWGAPAVRESDRWVWELSPKAGWSDEPFEVVVEVRDRHVFGETWTNTVLIGAHTESGEDLLERGTSSQEAAIAYLQAVVDRSLGQP